MNGFFKITNVVDEVKLLCEEIDQLKKEAKYYVIVDTDGCNSMYPGREPSPLSRAYALLNKLFVNNRTRHSYWFKKFADLWATYGAGCLNSVRLYGQLRGEHPDWELVSRLKYCRDMLVMGLNSLKNTDVVDNFIQLMKIDAVVNGKAEE